MSEVANEPELVTFTCSCGNHQTAPLAIGDTETCPSCGSVNTRCEGGMSGVRGATPEESAILDALNAERPTDGQPRALSPAENAALNAVTAGQPTKN